MLVGRVISWRYPDHAESQGIIRRCNSSKSTFTVAFPDGFVDRDFSVETAKSALLQDPTIHNAAQWLRSQRAPGALEGDLVLPEAQKRRRAPKSCTASQLVGRLVSWQYEGYNSNRHRLLWSNW